VKLAGRGRPQADGHDRLLWNAPFRSRALRKTSGALPAPEGEVNPTFMDPIAGSMKAPVRVANVDVRGCRRGSL